MRQFAIHRLKSRSSTVTRRVEFVIIIQHDRCDDTRTRVVAPLYLSSEIAAVGRLTADLLVAGQSYRAAFDQIAAIDASALGPEVDFHPLHDDLIRAVDLLFTGV